MTIKECEIYHTYAVQNIRKWLCLDQNNKEGKTMRHSNRIIPLSIKALLCSISLTLISCGGGGGGGGSAYPNVQYTGATNQATTTDDNASDFPVTMLEGSTSSNESNPFAAAIEGSTSTTQNAQHTAMLSILAKQLTNDISTQQLNSDNSQVSAVTQIINGTCATNPGSVNITDNSTSTNLSGSYTYSNYCVGSIGSGAEIEVHGKMSYSGSLFLAGDQPVFQSMTISVEYLKLTVRTSSETVSEEFSGSMTLTFDGTTANNVTGLTVTTNFEANGLTYKIENLVVDTSSGLNISGRFYHPTHGYVDVTTTTNFNLVSTNPDKYCAGTLTLTGAGGDVIEFTDTSTNCTAYDVCVTPDGGAPSCQTGLAWP